jgi:hypothetical protein
VNALKTVIFVQLSQLISQRVTEPPDIAGDAAIAPVQRLEAALPDVTFQRFEHGSIRRQAMDQYDKLSPTGLGVIAMKLI